MSSRIRHDNVRRRRWRRRQRRWHCLCHEVDWINQTFIVFIVHDEGVSEGANFVCTPMLTRWANTKLTEINCVNDDEFVVRSLQYIRYWNKIVPHLHFTWNNCTGPFAQPSLTAIICKFKWSRAQMKSTQTSNSNSIKFFFCRIHTTLTSIFVM